MKNISLWVASYIPNSATCWIGHLMNKFKNSKKSNGHSIEHLMKKQNWNSFKIIKDFNIDKRYGRCKLNKIWLRFTLEYGRMLSKLLVMDRDRLRTKTWVPNLMVGTT